MPFEKGNKKVINAWCWFDWANSVYPLVITTAIFPIYFNDVTSRGGSNIISFLGHEFSNSEFYSYLVSISFLMVSIVNPFLSGIADYGGKKKLFMKIFSTMGALSSGALFFFEDMNTFWVGVTFSILASVGFAGSLVFYNAYLPEIAHEEQMDMVSARGFTMGYIGSSLMLIGCLIMIMTQTDDESTRYFTRLSFLLAGLWWFGFALITFRGIPSNILHKAKDSTKLFSKGYEELSKVVRELRKPELKRVRLFLAGFFFYALGYMTVIYLATIFGQQELGLETGQLIMTVLIIQFVAIGGSYFFAWISGKIGNVRSLMIAVVIWGLVCGSTWFVTTPMHFYIVAFFVGTVMGGIQSLSRSTYAKLLPETEDHASFYSFYELMEKVGTAAGTFIFGFIIYLTGNMRMSTLFLAGVFAVGLFFLILVDKTIKSSKN